MRKKGYENVMLGVSFVLGSRILTLKDESPYKLAWVLSSSCSDSQTRKPNLPPIWNPTIFPKDSNHHLCSFPELSGGTRNPSPNNVLPLSAGKVLRRRPVPRLCLVSALHSLCAIPAS